MDAPSIRQVKDCSVQLQVNLCLLPYRVKFMYVAKIASPSSVLLEKVFFKMLFKSLGCNASMICVFCWLLLGSRSDVVLHCCLLIPWMGMFIFCENIVENEASVLIWALHIAMEYLLFSETHQVCICNHPRLYFFVHGLFLPQKYPSSMLKHIQATD